MEELAILPLVAALFMGEILALFLADLCGLALGLGWRHYSKKRAAQKAEKKRLKETVR
jgi:hypothetical protein